VSESIVVLQRRDHSHMQQLFTRYAVETPVERRATFRELVDLVTTHAFAEEEVLFPAARRELGEVGEQITSEIEQQHQRANELLKELESYEPGAAEFESRVRELFPLLESDARNEEDRLLAALERELGPRELEHLGLVWDLARRAAPNRSHPGIPRRPPGNVLAGIPLFFVDRMRGLYAKLRNHAQ